MFKTLFEIVVSRAGPTVIEPAPVHKILKMFSEYGIEQTVEQFTGFGGVYATYTNSNEYEEVGLNIQSKWGDLRNSKFSNGSMTKELLTGGADPNFVDINGWGPLQWFSFLDYQQSLKKLIIYGANLGAVERQQWSPLHLAAMSENLTTSGNVSTLEFLLKWHIFCNQLVGGTNTSSSVIVLDQQDNMEFNQMVDDMRQLHGETVENILRTAAALDANAVDAHDCTPLHYVADNGALQHLETLLKYGANINLNLRSRFRYGNTPLHTAVYGNHVNVVRVLVSAGAHLDIVDNQDLTPLDIAKRKNHLECVSILSAVLYTGMNAVSDDIASSMEALSLSKRPVTKEFSREVPQMVTVTCEICRRDFDFCLSWYKKQFGDNFQQPKKCKSCKK